MPDSVARHQSLSRPWTRRGLMATGFGSLVLTACGGDDDAETTPTAEPIATTEATLPPPTPTQPPIASPVPGYLDPERWAGRSLTIASPAIGATLDHLSAAFYDAFATATGATVRHQELGRDGYDGLRDQVDNEEVVWDVVLVPTEDVLPLAQTSYLTAVDYNVVDGTPLYEPLLMQHGVGARMYSTAIVYPSQAETPPADWADFWDLTTFAGTRALRRSPVGTLEFALLSTGVAPADLYPLDTEVAFTQLEKLRDATIFYEDSKTPVELVRGAQVGLASAWNVRTALPDVSVLVATQWNQGMISADSWVVPRGSANADVAMSFINFATRAVPTANYTTLENFGPVNTKALELIRPDIVEGLPNAPGRIEQQFFQNWAYWADVKEGLVTQFEDWLLNPVASPEPS